MTAAALHGTLRLGTGSDDLVCKTLLLPNNGGYSLYMSTSIDHR
jgi:hypothetical protein